MSALPIAGSAVSGSPNSLIASERVQQLQALIEAVERGSPTPSTASSFAATLDAAQTVPTSQSSAADPSSTYQTIHPAPQTAYPVSPYQETPPPTTPPPTTSTVSNASSTGSAYEPLIAQAAARYGLDPAILHGLIQQESDFDPAARSSSGALGLTQLMPGTAASLGVTEPLDPAQSIEGGARYLSEQLQRFGGNVPDAIAAYNAGPGAVQSYGGVPPYPETQEYVTKVLSYAAAYQQSAPTMATAQAMAPTMATAETVA
jgi:soluble lytic murein transglycosylase-like protein